jgi:hypothetical protein
MVRREPILSLQKPQLESPVSSTGSVDRHSPTTEDKPNKSKKPEHSNKRHQRNKKRQSTSDSTTKKLVDESEAKQVEDLDKWPSLDAALHNGHTHNRVCPDGHRQNGTHRSGSAKHLPKKALKARDDQVSML